MWCALAVGDSCLFRLGAGKLLYSFSLKRSLDFGNQPVLLGSRGRLDDTPQNAIRRARGRWRRGDRLLLTIDALAEWMLRRNEQGAFADWVQERRDRQGLRNDDVTLVVIDCIV
jgi:hypothetical protein